MSHTVRLGVLAAAIMAAAPAVQAYEAGDIIGRAGVAVVAPDSSSGNLNSNALGEIDGARVSVGSDTSTIDVDIDPWVYMVGVSYRF